jgi:DNA (cytosine-5)-methyltransferase 1
MPQNKTIRVIDLFAGVGGFRVGLKRASGTNGHYVTVWSNQFEPSSRIQHASEVYKARFGEEGHSNVDIAIEVKNDNVPNHDLLVGGFPCQDYSVARTLSQAVGIEGRKGVLWWEIYKILQRKIEIKRPTKYLFLENVDRLLKSPAKQRGRDFAIILKCLANLDYAAEWRVINAAEYGFPQRRRRTYILGYRKNTEPYKKMKMVVKNKKTGPTKWMSSDGVMAKAFPVHEEINTIAEMKLEKNVVDLSEKFNRNSIGAKSPFENAGMMIDGMFYSAKVNPRYDGEFQTLGQMLDPIRKIPKEYHIRKTDIPKWEYLKGAKSEKRKSKSGHIFYYTEGPMSFPDPLKKPSRTIITGEGGPTPSRFKHVVRQGSVLRRLTPVELERLSGFDSGHTEGPSDVKRAFFIGNSLVVGVVEKIGREFLKFI